MSGIGLRREQFNSPTPTRRWSTRRRRLADVHRRHLSPDRMRTQILLDDGNLPAGNLPEGNWGGKFAGGELGGGELDDGEFAGGESAGGELDDGEFAGGESAGGELGRGIFRRGEQNQKVPEAAVGKLNF
ncbi:hypothetical protein GPALN_012408 [Globodera pallida]|nr:hypothetical protein GPALN_012408 [Globodera pallida]